MTDRTNVIAAKIAGEVQSCRDDCTCEPSSPPTTRQWCCAPAEAEELPSAHPGVGGDPKGGAVPVVDGEAQENPKLLGVPVSGRRRAGERAPLRGVGELCWVEGEKS